MAAALASANPTAMAMARFAEGEALADADPVRASAALEEAADDAVRLLELGRGSA